MELKNTINTICTAKNQLVKEMAELKVMNVSLTSELRTDKDEYMEDLRTENRNYENDNIRMRAMVHMFHKLNPSLCPGCRGGLAQPTPARHATTSLRCWPARPELKVLVYMCTLVAA